MHHGCLLRSTSVNSAIPHTRCLRRFTPEGQRFGGDQFPYPWNPAPLGLSVMCCERPPSWPTGKNRTMRWMDRNKYLCLTCGRRANFPFDYEFCGIVEGKMGGIPVEPCEFPHCPVHGPCVLRVEMGLGAKSFICAGPAPNRIEQPSPTPCNLPLTFIRSTSPLYSCRSGNYIIREPWFDSFQDEVLGRGG